MRVLDGDTIIVNPNERIRLIRVDAPKSVAPNRPVDGRSDDGTGPMPTPERRENDLCGGGRSQLLGHHETHVAALDAVANRRQEIQTRLVELDEQLRDLVEG